MTPKPAPQDTRCTYLGGRGRCRLLRAEGHGEFCVKHWRREYDLDERIHLSPEAVALVSKIMGARESFKTATDVNDALAKLFCLRVRKLLSIRDTALLAYICQLILITLPGVHDDFLRLYDLKAWDALLEQALETADRKLPELDRHFLIKAR